VELNQGAVAGTTVNSSTATAATTSGLACITGCASPI
jgi:hypothetical protein